MSKPQSSTTNHDRSREQLYDIIAQEGESVADKHRQIIQLGTEYLGVDLGFVSTIDTDAETFEVLESTADDILATGAVYDLSQTYCRRCIESDSVLAVADAQTDGWVGDPAYEEHGLDCYLGTPIRVDGELVGTICFADEAPRDSTFTPVERAFVELAARLLGREYEIRQYERELDDRKARLDRRTSELAASEDKYRSLLATAPDAIFVIDDETGQIAEANDAAAELTGIDCDALVGLEMDSLYSGELPERYRAEIERFIHTADGTLTHFDDGTGVYFDPPDSSRVPVEISASTVTLDGNLYIQSIVRDVSDRRERQRELRLKGRAIEDAPVGITIADADPAGDVQENGLVYANERFEELTGYDWETIHGRNCRFLQGERTNQESVDELGTHIAAKEPVRTELLNYRRDGTPFWNEVSISPVENEAGEVTHFVGFQKDVTKRKRQSTLVDVLNRVLRHNLRNSMSVVLSRANILAESVEADGQPHLDSILGRAHDLVALSERARDIDQIMRSETESGPEPYDLVALVTDVVDDLRAEYPDATIETSLPETQSVKAEAPLRQAVHEVGTNALKHSGAAPTVSFSVAPTDAAGVVRLTVSDDGPGLPREEQTVLERGYETQLAHSSGLGLWFVNWVVTGVGGRVDATVDDGTTVTLTLLDPDAEHAGEVSDAGSQDGNP
jgi:PAS domain S-box-containing protein